MSEVDVAAIAARVFIGAVLLFAGFAKLRSPRWPLLAAEMGTPRLVIVALPAVELFLGLALVLQFGASLTAWLAVVLFGLFTVVVTVQYLSGSTVPCNCFGGKGEEAISKITIARNIGLVLLSLVATLP